MHWHVEQENPHASLAEVQTKTLDMIRNLVLDGLYELGTEPGFEHGFVPTDDLDSAMNEIRKEYVDNFDVWGWQHHWMLNIAPKGAVLGRPLMEAYRVELVAEQAAKLREAASQSSD